MKKITKIESNPRDTAIEIKLRVAAYCRVSTDSEEQLVSLETQRLHYESYIKANPNWEFAGIYYDEGISGTKKEKRTELLRMVSDCESKKIDFIVTKSISRFARNTMDCLELVRKLVSIGVYIYFEKENLNTQSMENELMLSILSGLAESESQSISENNKWSIQRRFKNGTYKISSPPYGYACTDGQIIVNKEQAEIVKFIFASVLSGKGTHKIAKELIARDIPTQRGGKWRANTILGILSNEKYVGDVILQKTYTDSSFNRHINDGDKDQYYIKDNHEAIITREDFEAVELLIDRRGKEKGIVKGSEKYQNRYSFSGNIICSECGSTFKRRIHGSRGNKYIAWCCSTHLSHRAECSMLYIKEEEIQLAFVTMMNKLIFGRKFILGPLLEGLRSMNKPESLLRIQELEKLIEKNAEQKQMLIKLMTKGYLEPALFNRENNELKIEADNYLEQQETLTYVVNGEVSKIQEVRDLLKFTNNAGMLSAFDEEVFSKYINKIMAFSREEIGFQLKCGITLKERM